MFFDPMYTMRRLLRAIPEPRTRSSVAATDSSETPAFGCCPACHDFVRVEPGGPSGTANCPNCGRLIRSLDALGSGGSLGRTPEV